MPPNEGDNSNFVQLREQYNAVVNDNKAIKEQLESLTKLKSELESKVTEAEREKMTEIERIKSINEEYSKKINELDSKAQRAEELASVLASRDAKLFDTYNATLEQIPEDKRELVKTITHYENDPIRSLDLLNAQIKLMGIKPLVQGTVTNPPNSMQKDGTKNPPEKLNPKDVKWSDAFAKSNEKIRQQLEERRKNR